MATATWGVPKRGWTSPTLSKKRSSSARAKKTRGPPMRAPFRAPKVDTMTRTATKVAPIPPKIRVAVSEATSSEVAISSMGRTQK